MFTRIFGKTTFLGYFIAFTLLLLAVNSHNKTILLNNSLEGSTLKLSVAGILSVISLIFVEWTVRRQLLFQTGSYHLLLFSLFFFSKKKSLNLKSFQKFLKMDIFKNVQNWKPKILFIKTLFFLLTINF